MRNILNRVFLAPAGGALHVATIRGKEGEIGLKSGSSKNYFGLIYIGDVSAFKKLIEEDENGIVLEEDVIEESLFESINKKSSSINVLIGAKKFMEGWNSWRVSSMGLLNIGRSEGSEIIQLFGRGVRLKGKEHTLKRSKELTGAHPENIQLLETLNIFAVRANYMTQFQDYLKREGVETDGYTSFTIELTKQEEYLNRGLFHSCAARGLRLRGRK